MLHVGPRVGPKLTDLQGLCWDAIYNPDPLAFTAPLTTLVGLEAVTRLEREVAAAIALTGGRASYSRGDAQDTETELLIRLLEHPDWAERMVEAYRTLIREGLDTVGVAVRDPDDEWVLPSSDEQQWPPR